MRGLTVGSIVLRHVELAQTEITQRDMTSVIQKDILRLQIPVISPFIHVQGQEGDRTDR